MIRARVLAVVASLAGCELIANIPTPSGTTDAGGSGSDAPIGTACASGEDCIASPAAPHCDLDSGVCVECLVAADCTTAAEPVCREHACRGCVVDSECPSQVCNSDGACADSARIAYAAPAGTGTACTLAAPCLVETALGKLTATVDILKLMPGSYTRTASLTFPISATLVGTGATFVGVPQDDGMFPTFYALVVVGGGTLAVRGLDFDLQGTIGAQCIGAGKQLVLSATKLRGGFYALEGYDGCATTIERSTISGHSLYGAFFGQNATVAISNSYFVDNNTGNSPTLTALYLENVSGTVTHTTFANNKGDNGAATCMTTPNVKFTSIISVANPVGTGMQPACDVAYSVVGAGFAGTNNTVVDPMFVAPAAGNYHLGPASPARGLGDPASTQAIDHDGDARPQPAGTRPDPGADEVP